MLQCGPRRFKAIISRPFSISRAVHLEFESLLAVDKKWKSKWAQTPASTRGNPPGSDAQFFYLLSMFPYPSGTLHMGHLRVYTIADIISRVKRLQGYDVLNPMGWDSFGLPAENAAVQRGVDPAEWTTENVEKMKLQMQNMLADFDWDRELKTSDPEYYKWTQKLFLLLYENNMAYRKKAEINWDPVDKTVLANEQVDAQGRSWRSGAIVEKRNLEQWFVKTTEFAGSLRNDLDLLKNWPDFVKIQQKNWIGQSFGTDITFKAQSIDTLEEIPPIQVFTTRPETIFSIQFLALALDHPIVQKMAENDSQLAEFVRLEKLKDDPLSKSGYKLPIKVSLPMNLNGELHHSFDIDVYTAPYVISGYGNGAVMGCPAHDERDLAFFKELSSEATRPTVFPSTDSQALKDSEIYTGKEGIMGGEYVGKYTSLATKDASKSIVEDLKSLKAASSTTHYRLRDWLISRQRYWGAPIPIIHCGTCGEVPVPEQQLPVLLPEIPHVAEAFQKGNPLANHKPFVDTTCPKCNNPAKRDTDTMDTFMDLSWYFFRYLDPQNTSRIFDRGIASKQMPVDLYLGGNEHAILHLLYARFISKFLHSIGAYDGASMNGEPFKRLLTQGMVTSLTFRDSESKRVLSHEEAKNRNGGVLATYEKMSKSKFNGVDPTEVISEYGADSVRGSIVFQAPLNAELKWLSEQIKGVSRWLEKVRAQIDAFKDLRVASDDKKLPLENVVLEGLNGQEFHNQYQFGPEDFALYKAKYNYVKLVTAAIDETFTFNTIVSDFMKLTNAISSSNASKPVILDAYITLLIMMAPVVPCMAEECYEVLRNTFLGRDVQWESIFNRTWPKNRKVVDLWREVGVMVDGKKRFVLQGNSDFHKSSQQEVLTALKQFPQYEKWLGKGFDSIFIKKLVVVIQTKK